MKNPAKKLALALLCLLSAWSLSAQTTVKGVVTDETGEPLIGAGVVVVVGHRTTREQSCW